MLDVSVFPGLRSTIPERQSWPLSRLRSWVRDPMRGSKVSAPLWSPALYPPGATRGSAQVEAVSALVLDYDGGATWDQGLAPWRAYAHCAHTSYSHAPRGREYDVWKHCYRVVVPLEVPIPAALHPRLWQWASDLSPGLDPACKDAARLYYQPVHDQGAGVLAYWYELVGGPVLDWRTLDLPEVAPRVTRSAPLIDLTGLPPSVVDRVRWTHLEHDAEARAQWVAGQGGQIVERGGARIGIRIRCPRCGQPDLCVWIDYTDKKTAWCNHANSCGYFGRPWKE